MSNIDSAMETVKSQIEQNRQRQKKVTSVLQSGESKVGELGVGLDIENAELEDVQLQQEAMNGNIAELIVELDEVTAGFGKQFDTMRSKTMGEKLIGFLSSHKSESMRASRIRNTNIDSKLADLIGKSNVIIGLLQEQLKELETQQVKVSDNLSVVLAQRGDVVSELEQIRNQLQQMDPEIIRLENKISMEADAAKRTELESELQNINETHNELVQQEQVKLALSQTLEKYIKMGQTFVDSLQNQVATQMVLVDKLQTDTEQRVLLYDALNKSLKTAQQQDVAHRINDIGSAVDNEAQTTMAHIGAATNQRIAEMLEAHEGNMAFSQMVQEQKAKADERFARRFATVMERHDRANYTASAD